MDHDWWKNIQDIFIISPRFTSAGGFTEGLAVVTLEKGRNAVYIDRSGKTILTPGIDGAGVFHEGLAVITAGGKTGYIDRTGSVVVKPRYDFGGSFCEGMAAVQKGKKMGFIDRSGAEVISLEWDEVNNFSEGLARVKRNGRADFIDKTGKIYPLQSDSVYAAYFHEGYAAIPKDIMSWGYVKSPLSKTTEAKTVVSGGFCVGSVREIKRGDVIVTGPVVGSLVAAGDSLAVEGQNGVIVLRAVYPMMASCRCIVTRGSLKDLAPGMKAFRMAQRDTKK